MVNLRCFCFQITTLTGEGGKLKRTVPLSRGRDFEILPDPVWKALVLWYGGGPPLPRTVSILYSNGIIMHSIIF